MDIDKFREPTSVFPANLNAQEQDLFALILRDISKVVGTNVLREKEGKLPIEIPHVFEFTEEQIMDAFGCKKRNILKTLEPAAKRLKDTEVGYRDEKGFDYFSPIARVQYKRGDTFKMFTLPSVSEMMAEDIKNGFSEMDFRLFVSLSGRYGRRILKAISQWKSEPSVELKFSLQEYRELIGVPADSYTDYMGKEGPNFRKKCIQEPFEDIIATSRGIWVPTDTVKTKTVRKTKEVIEYQSGYELIKTGRKYTHIVFKLKYKSPELLAKEGRKRIKEISDEIKGESDADREYQKFNFMFDNDMGDRLTEEEKIKYQAICEVMSYPMHEKFEVVE